MVSSSPNRLEKLQRILENKVISSKMTAYYCKHIDGVSTIFSESEGTRKVMIPTDVILEWISALESGMIDIEMKAREMRNIVKSNSEWAPYQHGFETHLKTILLVWSSVK